MSDKLTKVIDSLTNLGEAARDNNEPILSAIFGLHIVLLEEIRKELSEESQMAKFEFCKNCTQKEDCNNDLITHCDLYSDYMNKHPEEDV